MNLNMIYIQEYITLAEQLNFTKAAEMMHIAQPSLSRHITIVEETMGARLLERDTKSVSLTEAGMEVYKTFVQILNDIYACQEKIAASNVTGNGEITVCSPYYWTEDYTESLIMRFAEKYPEAAAHVISCQPAEGMELLADGKCDIAVNLYQDNISNEIRRVPFAEEELYAYMEADHPLASGESIAMADILQYPVVCLKNGALETEKYREMLLEQFKQITGSQPSVLYSEQVDTLPLYLKKTRGISILSKGIRHMNRSYIKALPIRDLNLRIPMCLYYRVDSPNRLIPVFVQMANLQVN